MEISRKSKGEGELLHDGLAKETFHQTSDPAGQTPQKWKTIFARARKKEEKRRPIAG